MSRFGKIVRRSFLVGSVAIVGGVAFGVYRLRQPAANPLAAGPGEAALNPFVFIDQSGVTLIAPKAEMGQGVRTTWAALIAEELDVALDDVRILHGPPARAYYNGALMTMSLPMPDYAVSDRLYDITRALGPMGRVVNVQMTGGSTSMIDGFDRMREAGASARETLKEAAAQRLGVDRATLTTDAGAVVTADGARLPYPELAEAAAGIEPPQVGLRDPSEWRLLGRSQPRVDMVGKATGTAEFGVDVRRPGMKFAALRRNPNLGAGMRSFRDEAARDMDGVERVVDLGDGVAVVANNTWTAMKAVEAIQIAWDIAPYPAETDEIFTRIENSFHDRAGMELRDDGDVLNLPPDAELVTAEYRAPYLAHATMEPMNATALYTGDALEIWCGNQVPTFVQWKCAQLAGLDVTAVTVHTPYLGGGFGRRLEWDYAEAATRVAMAMEGTPVQVTWSREEDMTHDFYRPAGIARFRGAVRNGRALIVDGQIASQSVVDSYMTRLVGLAPMMPDKILVEGAFNQPYAIPNYRIRGYKTDLDIPVGSWRSVGNSLNAFFLETYLDELAVAAGADPLEFRLQLAAPEHAPSAGVIEAVREMSDWTGQTPEGVGRGVAFTHSFGTACAQVIEVVQEDGGIRIARAWIACDVGLALDPAIVEAQMVGGMIYGLSAAAFGEITFAGGQVEQRNFPDYDALRMHTTPVTEVLVRETDTRMGGAGEPGTPPAMPALGNALYDLTGRRARSMPFRHEFDLLI